ncbi:MAG: enoyl-CoA hydratase/isomerase family protein [Thermoguttaceae bacterium]|nr:enoyl-CoA hydratase/isomerase family protein [Thermoguttaceae bacterium]
MRKSERENHHPLLYREEETVAIAAFNRPEKCNALSLALLESLEHRLEDLETRRNIRVLIVAGLGNHFCGGLDLREAAEDEPVEIPFSRAERFCRKRLPKRILESFPFDPRKKAVLMPKGFWMPRLVTDILYRLPLLPQTVIGIGHGGAYGGGGALLASCDIALGAPDLRLGFPECRRGLEPALLHPFLTRRTSPSALYPYLLSGEAIPLCDALRIGFVDFPLGEEISFAQIPSLDEIRSRPALKRIIEGVLAGSPQMVRQTKRRAAAETLPAESTVIGALWRHWKSWNREPAREGIRAFLEKRAPRWD